MPRQRRFYDPFIQQPEPSHVTPEPNPIQGYVIDKPGVLIHVDDVVATLRLMALGVSQIITGKEALEAAAVSFESYRVDQ